MIGAIREYYDCRPGKPSIDHQTLIPAQIDDCFNIKTTKEQHNLLEGDDFHIRTGKKLYVLLNDIHLVQRLNI